MSRLIKGVLREFGYEAGIEICRGYMIERLREVTSNDLYKAIKNGTHSMGVSEAKDKQFAGKWVKIIEKLSYKGERLSRDKLKAENVLEWLKNDRVDLASLIINMNPEGMNWLKDDVKQVYAFLFPPQQKPALTLVKREQPKKDETADELASAKVALEKVPETPKEAQIEEKPQETASPETQSEPEKQP